MIELKKYSHVWIAFNRNTEFVQAVVDGVRGDDVDVSWSDGGKLITLTCRRSEVYESREKLIETVRIQFETQIEAIQVRLQSEVERFNDFKKMFGV